MESVNSITLKLENISKQFGGNGQSLTVLRDVSFTANEGESIAITGPSGSGKSTLLHLIGTLDRPSSGSLTINAREPALLSDDELARFRNRVIGFVFQDHYLLPQYSVLENVLMPTVAWQQTEPDAQGRATELLTRVGLQERLEHRPAQLSGGERQRVAIARALINKPAIVLCDEPTGNLDQKTAQTVAGLFFELHKLEHNILIMVTHSLDLAKQASRHLELREGTCVEV
jgi:lipoprotein-releasing system ATP-binding protein